MEKSLLEIEYAGVDMDDPRDFVDRPSISTYKDSLRPYGNMISVHTRRGNMRRFEQYVDDYLKGRL